MAISPSPGGAELSFLDQQPGMFDPFGAVVSVVSVHRQFHCRLFTFRPLTGTVESSAIPHGDHETSIAVPTPLVVAGAPVAERDRHHVPGGVAGVGRLLHGPAVIALIDVPRPFQIGDRLPAISEPSTRRRQEMGTGSHAASAECRSPFPSQTQAPHEHRDRPTPPAPARLSANPAR